MSAAMISNNGDQGVVGGVVVSLILLESGRLPQSYN